MAQRGRPTAQIVLSDEEGWKCDSPRLTNGSVELRSPVVP